MLCLEERLGCSVGVGGTYTCQLVFSAVLSEWAYIMYFPNKGPLLDIQYKVGAERDFYIHLALASMCEWVVYM